jgi:hypothetical protein
VATTALRCVDCGRDVRVQELYGLTFIAAIPAVAGTAPFLPPRIVCPECQGRKDQVDWLLTVPRKGDICLCADCGTTLTWDDEVSSHTRSLGPPPAGFPADRLICNACRWGKR